MIRLLLRSTGVGTMRELFIHPNTEKLAQAAADLITEVAEDATATRGEFHLALSGGSTPRPVYSLLVREPFRDKIVWEKVHLWWGDERCVPPDHLDSNYHMAYETLISQVPIPEGHIHRIPAELPPDQAAQAYEAALKQQFPDEQFPCLDLILLGMGEDGHTTSLFPHTVALAESKRWVVANFVEKPAAWRVTMTVSLINAARQVAVLVSGADKAGMLKQVLQGPYLPESLPIQMIQPTPGRLLWLLDAPAAAEL